jgi:hypothetical protein
VPNVPSSPFSLREAVSYVVTAHPSSIYVSMMRFSCTLGPLIWGIGACGLRAQWTSRFAVKMSLIAYGQISRSWIALSHMFLIIASAQRNMCERPRLTTQRSMEPARSAAGRRKARLVRSSSKQQSCFFSLPAVSSLYSCYSFGFGDHRGCCLGPVTLVGGQYLEMQINNAHGEYIYM